MSPNVVDKIYNGVGVSRWKTPPSQTSLCAPENQKFTSLQLQLLDVSNTDCLTAAVSHCLFCSFEFMLSDYYCIVVPKIPTGTFSAKQSFWWKEPFHESSNLCKNCEEVTSLRHSVEGFLEMEAFCSGDFLPSLSFGPKHAG